MGLHSEAQLDRRYIEMVRLLNLYLNHFPRHEKYGLSQMIRRVVYEVYALIVEGQKRYQKKTTLTNLDIRHEQLRMLVRLAHRASIIAFLAANLGLELSKSTVAPVRRGANFVGYRTWASRRFVRRHALFTFRRAARHGRMESVVSSLGHARRTASLRHMVRHLQEYRHALYRQLPKSLRRHHHLPTGRA